MKAVLRALLLLVVVGAIASCVVAYIARATRYLATPAALRSQPNPVEPAEAVLAEGLQNFADHCGASCHANYGSGETTMGRTTPVASHVQNRGTNELAQASIRT